LLLSFLCFIYCVFFFMLYGFSNVVLELSVLFFFFVYYFNLFFLFLYCCFFVF